MTRLRKPGHKTVIVALTVTDATDKHDLACSIDYWMARDWDGVDCDATVWEWEDFWSDLDDGVVSRTSPSST